MMVNLASTSMLMLANPFGYFDECITWGMGDHLAQACADATWTEDWGRVFETMLFVCQELGNHVVGFNETCGNSIDHLHIVSHRPPDGIGPYPVQQVAASLGADQGILRIGLDCEYPMEVFRFCLPDLRATSNAAAALMAKWRQQGGSFASANAAAVIENGSAALYVIPRNKILKPWGWQSNPAFLEMCGVFIASRAYEVARVRRGLWGYEHFFRVLASLRPQILGKVALPVTA